MWDTTARAYDSFNIENTFPLFAALAVQCKVYNKKRILEVACGSGMHSLFLAKTMLQRGGVLVATDFSEKFIDIMVEKFESAEEDYSKVEGNKYKVEAKDLPEGFDLNAFLKDQNFKDTERFVLGAVANNECLPFADAQFDCYIANLSLMLVDNYKNQLTEALRVTTTGASFGFTILGRKENSKFNTVPGGVLAKHNVMAKPAAGSPPPKSPFDVSADPPKLREEMEAMGFTQIRMWYQMATFNTQTGEEFVQSIIQNPMMKGMMGKLTEE